MPAVVKVLLTDAARELLDRIRLERSGPLSLVIGNGCCDSTAPFLFEHHLSGPGEARVGELPGDVEVVLDRALLELFEGREVVIDAQTVACADSFSCEAEYGMRFTLERLPGVEPAAAPGQAAGASGS
jgi:uncharacterized protein (DUF779 family)